MTKDEDRRGRKEPVKPSYKKRTMNEGITEESFGTERMREE